MNDLPLKPELPLGLGMAMAQFPTAMERFAALSEEDQRALVERARSARSRQDMRACVDSLMNYSQDG